MAESEPNPKRRLLTEFWTNYPNISSTPLAPDSLSNDSQSSSISNPELGQITDVFSENYITNSPCGSTTPSDISSSVIEKHFALSLLIIPKQFWEAKQMLFNKILR